MPLHATGSKSVVTISGPETTPGQVPGTPAGQIFPFFDESLQRKTELTKSNLIRASRNPSRPTRGKREVSGSIQTNLTTMMARQLMMAFGDVTTTGAGPYTHVFKIGDSLPYHTIERAHTDLTKFLRYYGCKCGKFGLELNPSGALPLSMDFLGMDRTVEVATFDASALDLGADQFDAFEATLKEGGANATTVTAIKIDLENSLDGDVYCIGGGGKRYNIPEGSVVVSGSLVALFDSDALLTKAINGTESSLEIVLAKGAGDGTAGNEKLTIQVDELIFQEQDPIIKSDKGILIELPWTAFWGAGVNGSAIMATLLNQQSSAS